MISPRPTAEPKAADKRAERARYGFDVAAVGLWEQECSELLAWLEHLRGQGITDLRAHLDRHPDLVPQALDMLRLVDVNQEAVRILGARTKEELIKAVGNTFTDYSLDVFKEELIALFEGQRTLTSESWARTLTGEEKCFQITTVIPEAGPDARAVVTLIDITERKLATRALRNADQRKDEFLATLAHELRNPLAPIMNAVQILNADPSPQQAAAAREIISRQTRHMVRLVDDLLDISRITLGLVNLRREPLVLEAVVRDAIDAVRPLLDKAGHRLDIDLPAEALPLQGDGTRLSQVLQNLLNNACKYTPRGGHITLTARRVGDDIVVTVRDTGIGVPKAKQARIFELFTRFEPTDRIKVSGLGIGLALSKRLVELHGGRLELESEGEGRGSAFHVYLPAVTRAAANGSRVAAGVADRHAPKRVLVVDDNRDAAASLAMLLQLEGHEVHTAFDGPQALAAVSSFRPDVVLLDIGMPGMDGYEVARHIRGRPEGVPVRLVALTGWGQEEDRRRAKAAGFDLHVTKPVDPSSLESLLY